MAEGMKQTPVIACFKWGKGYPTRDTNILFRALSDRMSVPFRFVCLTDDPTGLDAGIEAIELPAFRLEREYWVKGMWPKLAIFKPGLFAPGTPVMMIDVDVVILRDLAPMIEHVVREGGLHIIHDWHDTHERWWPRLFPKERLSNSSVVGFIAGEQTQIWDDFHDAGWDVLQPQKNDQDFIHYHAHDRHFWPAPWVVSFKKSLAWHFPVNFLRPVPCPPDGYIVAFHGVPNPEDMAQAPFKRWGSAEKFGYFPVGWIKAYMDKYAPEA